MARTEGKYTRRFYTKRHGSSKEATSDSTTSDSQAGSERQEDDAVAAALEASSPPAASSASAPQAAASSSSAGPDASLLAAAHPGLPQDLHLPLERSDLQKLLDTDSESEAELACLRMDQRHWSQIRSPGILAVPSVASASSQPVSATPLLPLNVPWNHRMVPAVPELIDSDSDDLGPDEHVYLPGYGLEPSPSLYSDAACSAFPCDSHVGQALGTDDGGRPEVMSYMLDKLSRKDEEVRAAQENRRQQELADRRETLIHNLAFMESLYRRGLEELASSQAATCADTEIDSPSDIAFADTLLIDPEDAVEETPKPFFEDAEQAIYMACLGHQT